MGVLGSLPQVLLAARDALVGPSLSELLVLNVRLLFGISEPVVRLALEQVPTAASAEPGEDAPPSTLPPWEVEFARFTQGEAFAIPPEVAHGLLERIQGLGAGPELPLWLRLVRPYGTLGVAPWEKTLVESIARPVLRLTEFPDRPRERPDVLQNVLVVEPGEAPDIDDVMRRVQFVVDALLAASSRTVTDVHVFTSARLHDRMSGLASRSNVHVHKPEAPADSKPRPSSGSTPFQGITSSAWTRWIAQSLEGRGIDALHFIGRAEYSDDGARLLLPCAPSECRHAPDVAVEVSEFELLMNRSGAWASTLVPCAPRYAQAVRCFADALARSRPAAVLFHELPSQGTDDVRAAFRLLFGGKPARAGRWRDGLLYCHPSFVGAPLDLAQQQLLRALASHAAVLAQRAPLGQRLLRSVTSFLPGVTTSELSIPPNWVGSTQRFLESAAFQELRSSAEDVLFTRSSLHGSKQRPRVESPATDELLSEIQSVIENYLRAQGKGGPG